MKKTELYKRAIDYFAQAIPIAETELDYTNAFDLLVAVILSAQCTDKRVNMVTPDLIARYPDAQEMAQAHPDEIYNYIKSVSYPNNKAKHLVGMTQKLCSDFGGEVPDTLEELTTLPGVGRKTANVILSVVWDKSAMAVDTQVFRVSHRIGLVPKRCTTPYSVEMELMKHLPHDIIPKAHHWLILHGRYMCKARNPECNKCGLKEICKEATKRANKA
jgi:endonuclease-3